ncbi:hypothetical protein DRN67_00200, partial [Candidatus Micrarchaeota archaeon]
RNAKDVMVLCDCSKRELLKELGANELKPKIIFDRKEAVKRFGLTKKVLANYSFEEAVLERVALVDLAG